MARIEDSARLHLLSFSEDKMIESHRDNYVRFEVFTPVTVKNGVVWEVTPCGSCKNQRCGGM
jgi:hypothetical protein